MRNCISYTLFVGLLQWVLTTNGLVLGFASPDSDKLDYRCALPSDVIPRPERLTDDSADFVAVDPKDKPGEPVVANVEYATITKPGYGKWVYIDGVEVRKDWHRKGVATKLLTKLFAYIKTGWPEITGVFLLVDPSNAGAKILYEKMGFLPHGTSAHDEGKYIVYDGYVYNFDSPAAAKLPHINPPKNMPMPSTPDPFVVKTFNDIFGHKTE
ncbi:hypothetical protein Pmar_PMAR016234 [Perkinsus marinus ATCC 50983]|uniref:N-acetyltransferase domain-containing protein n=1 Tax=Perkinsus marinus (strain ATCC 50983 / TXsc) TaxID=423536 RepID=C5KIX3_PERM5|nr:hypothetical protein Pmar_PMAR016234 [Perkinsus marinus ATCC 50983]EER15549.1 hypothetical protein Pmar_PMAR016234 [Perkinsus marinus ATCC 50983]|eukprot:XP_002783753.1 hypothetical protein Pmar_PMAR016234 [Perkinsus marinus ATCC 50983]